MLGSKTQRIGYVLKVYPRYSETFILNEILAHEKAGLELEIFSLRPPTDGVFHDALTRIRARVTYLPHDCLKGVDLWQAIRQAHKELPNLWHVLEDMLDKDAHDVYQAVMLACEVQARGITHLHAHFGSVATTVARLASQMANISYSFTAHAKDIYHESVQHQDLHRKISDAAFVVTVSQYNLTYLRQSYGALTETVDCVYNGLDLDHFPYCSPLERPARIVAVGRLIEKKGFAYLIDACRLLADQGREFQVGIIGAGELEVSLRAQVDRLNLAGRVNLLGPLPQSEVKQHIQQAAVTVVPCVVGQDGNRDGLPTVLLESMALGTPCVSTDVTGIPEVLRDGETGLMVPQRDPVALASACTRLLDDSELRVRLATRACDLIEKEFEIHRNTSRIREHFAAAYRQASNEAVKRFIRA